MATLSGWRLNPMHEYRYTNNTVSRKNHDFPCNSIWAHMIMIITFMHNINNHIIYKLLGRTTHLMPKIQYISKNGHHLNSCAWPLLLIFLLFSTFFYNFLALDAPSRASMWEAHVSVIFSSVSTPTMLVSSSIMISSSSRSQWHDLRPERNIVRPSIDLLKSWPRRSPPSQAKLRNPISPELISNSWATKALIFSLRF